MANELLCRDFLRSVSKQLKIINGETVSEITYEANCVSMSSITKLLEPPGLVWPILLCVSAPFTIERE